jgi:DNA-binding response OmpR family regulator
MNSVADERLGAIAEGGRMILLLTPTEDLQEQIDKFLKDRGHEVCVPCSPADVKSHIEASHTDLVILDMHVDQPRGNLVLHNLREGGYTGRLIILFGPSQVYSMATSYSSPVNTLLRVPIHTKGSYDLGALGMAVESSLGAVQ